MTVTLGSSEWAFEVEESWAKIPDDIVLGDCAAVGVDSKDNVYAFNRGDHPMAVFDNDGNLLRTWGEGVFTRPHSEPHGVHMAPDDTIWLTDDGDHTVRHCTLDGRVLLTIGIPGKPSPFMSGERRLECEGGLQYGVRSVRVDLPTLEDALFAAEGLTRDTRQQIHIAAALMQVPVDQARAEAERISKDRAGRPQVEPGRRTPGGPVIVERRPARRAVRAAPR